MNQKFSNILSSILIIVILFLLGYIFLSKQTSVSKEFLSTTSSLPPTIVTPTSSPSTNKQNNNNLKIFVFDNFHASSNISLKFQFQYPANWYNEGQYFSPEKIGYYDLYSVKAPIYFDLIRADIFDQTEFKNQINIDKRKSRDSHGKIDNQEFEKYDLIDYGSYGGESAGRVIIYVGPKIIIDGEEYYLVFHWEERPLTAVVFGNNPIIFENIVLSLKFTN